MLKVKHSKGFGDAQVDYVLIDGNKMKTILKNGNEAPCHWTTEKIAQWFMDGSATGHIGDTAKLLFMEVAD